MALTARKTVMLEKQYLYVKASKGFQLEGTNIEKIWVNTGYYRFLVDNVAKALSNSYVDILYDPSDIDFIAYCSDLFMEELQNTVVVAVENLQSYVEQFYDRNHEDISELSEGLSGALRIISNKISEPYDLVFYCYGGSSNVCYVEPSMFVKGLKIKIVGGCNNYNVYSATIRLTEGNMPIFCACVSCNGVSYSVGGANSLSLPVFNKNRPTVYEITILEVFNV